MHYTTLSRSVLSLSGPDVRTFLQGLLTADMRRVTPDAPTYALLLSPQGKFLHEMFVLEHDGQFLIDTVAERAEELRKRFMMYRLRAKVEIAASPLRVWALWGEGDAPASSLCIADPRLAALGYRLYAEHAPDAAEGDYNAHRLALAVPNEQDLLIDKSLPLEWGMDALNAIRFDKGCYVGQEVTARMHHRAVMRHYVHAVETDAPALPPAGTPVMLGEQVAGALHSSQNACGLARLSLDITQRSNAQNRLIASGVTIVAYIPKWIAQ